MVCVHVGVWAHIVFHKATKLVGYFCFGEVVIAYARSHLILNRREKLNFGMAQLLCQNSLSL